MMIKLNKHKQTEQGFTLVEMAIGMVIVSLLVAFATVAFSGLLRRGFEKKTFQDMEVVADAIAVYAQRHMRVPCPADPTGSGSEPFGAEIGSDGDGDNVVDQFGVCDTIATAEGIIPFATLGLPQRLARDRFGNWITYRVSLTSAQTPTTASALPINHWCMTRPYWHQWFDNNNDDIVDAGEEQYVNLAKAAFCCGTWFGGAAPDAGTNGDIEIRGSFGALPNLNRLTPRQGGDVREYINTVPVTPPPTYLELQGDDITPFTAGTHTTIPPTFPAYILVSHGQNGLGAFGSSGTRPTLTGMTTPEAENADSDVIFYASDRLATQDPGAGNQQLFRPDMDDIVYWQTPAQTIGRIGGMSCSTP